MKISLFVSGKKTIIGIINEDDAPQVLEVDSKVLFFDPELFRDRFLLILKNSFGIQVLNKTDTMIFAVTGSVDAVTGDIIMSYNLNDISYGKRYEGFSFRKSFEDLVDINNIYVINDAQVAGLGVLRYLTPELPCLVLTNDIGLGVSLIKESGRTEAREWGSELLEDGRNFHQLLNTQSVNKMLIENRKDILGDYTECWTTALDRMIKIASDNSVEFRSVVIISERSELIIKKTIKDLFKNLRIVFPEKSVYINIFLAGCFAVPEVKNGLRVQKIEYYSGEEKIYEFENYEDFRDHWKIFRDKTNGENEYRFYYDDMSVKKVKIRHLEREEELKQYLF